MRQPIKTQTASGWRKRLAIFLLLMLASATVFSLAMGDYGLLAIIETRQEIARLKQAQKEYNAKLVDLEYTRNRLLADSLYLEKIARQNYRMGRADEMIIEF